MDQTFVIPTCAVVVICHNYGRFLAECLESVLEQTSRPTEIIVIDDSSTDETPEIARRFASHKVRYVRVDCRNVHQARRAGVNATTAEVVCFLDADDALTPVYLAEGLKLFCTPHVGIVYSDLEFFGNTVDRSRFPLHFDRAQFELDNFIHAGGLVRREALRLSRAFDRTIDPLLTQGDWFLWRQVLRDGWTAVKQPSLYRYRQHGANWTGAMHQTRGCYFDYAGLAHESVTLFIPLSGRSALWPGLAAYLDRQTWPHAQVKLVFFDTSQSDAFSKTIRNWIASCDYPDVRHVCVEVGRAGVADDDRYQAKIQEEVRDAVARIYNRMARDVTTDYVWIVEDDILPPDNACESLLRGFDRETASVSGMYLSRYDGLPCVWDRNFRHFTRPGHGLQVTCGNGFGCVVLRGGILRTTVFQGTGDYDRVFYRQLQGTALKAKVDWRVVCDHRPTTADERRPPANTTGPLPTGFSTTG